jgi:hypothetical protein
VTSSSLMPERQLTSMAKPLSQIFLMCMTSRLVRGVLRAGGGCIYECEVPSGVRCHACLFFLVQIWFPVFAFCSMITQCPTPHLPTVHGRSGQGVYS